MAPIKSKPNRIEKAAPLEHRTFKRSNGANWCELDSVTRLQCTTEMLHGHFGHSSGTLRCDCWLANLSRVVEPSVKLGKQVNYPNFDTLLMMFQRHFDVLDRLRGLCIRRMIRLFKKFFQVLSSWEALLKALLFVYAELYFDVDSAFEHFEAHKSNSPFSYFIRSVWRQLFVRTVGRSSLGEVSMDTAVYYPV